MSGYLVVDKTGWIEGTVISDIVDKDDYPNKTLIEIKKSEIADLMSLQQILFWDGEKICQAIKREDIWDRLRMVGLSGQQCSYAFKRVFGIVKYPPIPNSLKIETPPVLGKTYLPSFVSEIRPGLRIELSKQSDVDLWTDLMVKSGLYTEDEAWLNASSWLSDPLVWGIKVMWKERLLQLDTYHFNINGSVSSGFNTHLERRLPTWFWAQITKVIYNSFLTLGITHVDGYVRSDKRNWIDNIKKMYGSKEIKDGGKFVHLRNDVENVINSIGDWPQRRTISGWKFEKSGCVVKEVTEDDRDMVSDLVEKSWGNSPRKELAMKILEDDWELCNCSFLIITKNNEVMGMVGIREKEPTIGFLTFPFKRPTTSDEYNVAVDVGQEALFQWEKEVGYKEHVAIVETKLTTRGTELIKDRFKKRGYDIADKNGMTTIKINVDEALKAYT